MKKETVVIHLGSTVHLRYYTTTLYVIHVGVARVLQRWLFLISKKESTAHVAQISS
jgi:hypothetical protein